jgi:hypothetical protein
MTWTISGSGGRMAATIVMESEGGNHGKKIYASKYSDFSVLRLSYAEDSSYFRRETHQWNLSHKCMEDLRDALNQMYPPPALPEGDDW